MTGQELNEIIEFARDIDTTNRLLCSALNQLESLQNNAYYKRMKESGLFSDEEAIVSEWIKANRSNDRVAPVVVRENDMLEFFGNAGKYYK